MLHLCMNIDRGSHTYLHTHSYYVQHQNKMREIYVVADMCDGVNRTLAFFPSANITLCSKPRQPTGPIKMYGVLKYPQQNFRSRKNARLWSE